MCDFLFFSGDSDDEEEDEEEISNNSKNKDYGDRLKCDDGKKCYCMQLYDDYFEYFYVFIRVVKLMFVDLFFYCEVRDLDNFEMYIFNDYLVYGVLEIFQNFILDFEEVWQLVGEVGCV